MTILNTIIISAVVIGCCSVIAYCDLTIIREIKQFRQVMQDILEEMERR